ncbi:lytic murein transglycosylase [Sphingomonas astaxanthinifaciens]|uniref:Lytic transglycosylase n=1 Tax=Sphingomonas astaxanthinifaciens DSM 22298 TaxID=1123267 RepID=A0ABQ5Z6U8_9SPHN|nr:lytic murein transglycosylase [Sphingomonas astaxanthinifaciens]GLR47717.1 lytic transglycosylase [Sphingomonas astaxanthinifaciens DSM 22298]
MAFRWSASLLCLSAIALTPASARLEPDPLAPLPDRPAEPPRTAPAPAPVQVRTLPPEPIRIITPAASTYGAVSGFAGYKQRLASLARTAGVREATIAATVPYVTQNARVVALDRQQPGGPPNSSYIPPFAPYKAEHVTPDLINRGAARFRNNRAQLAWLEQRFGVEPQVVMAIFGHETSYGRVTGNFDLLDVLATLAYEGRRRSFFEEEFVAALQLIDRGTPRSRLKGSWAGATGYPQFMPSNVLRLATDGDGDGQANIWGSEMDGLASIAAYLRDAGWKRGVHWGIPVNVPASLNRAALRTTLNPPRCPQVFRRHSRWLTMREWRALGVQPQRTALADSEMATLIEPDGQGATAYLLSVNYRAILDYNCSNFYALSVGLLADRIAAGG